MIAMEGHRCHSGPIGPTGGQCQQCHPDASKCPEPLANGELTAERPVACLWTSRSSFTGRSPRPAASPCVRFPRATQCSPFCSPLRGMPRWQHHRDLAPQASLFGTVQLSALRPLLQLDLSRLRDCLGPSPVAAADSTLEAECGHFWLLATIGKVGVPVAVRT